MEGYLNLLPQFKYLILAVLVGGLAWYFWHKQHHSSGHSLGISFSKFPTLGQYSRDLTKMALEKKLDPVIGRKKEIRRVIQLLSRRTKNNPVLIGNAGVGKTAIVEGLAERIVKKQVPSVLYDKRVLALDLSAILAGTKYRGEFEDRLKKVTDEIMAANQMIILFIDEIHILAQAGEAEGAINASDILKPLLARGELHVVGATTGDEYEKYIKKDKTLDRRLQPVFIGELSPVEVKETLVGIKKIYENFHQVKILESALTEAISGTKNIKNRSYPDKAIDALDEACSKVRLDNLDGKNTIRPEVSAASVKAVISEWRKN